jgi:hypothetical protein
LGKHLSEKENLVTNMTSLKKIRITILATILLTGISIWIIKKNKPGTIRKELFDFAVADTSSITKIYLVNTSGKQLTLVKEKIGQWQINGKYNARNDAIKNLLSCIKDLQVRTPVAKSALENISKQMATSSTKIEIYQGDKLAKSYYIGSDTQDGLGTFMLLIDSETGENSTLPFVMFIPGFNGFLSIRYFMDEDLWRNRSIFAFYPDQISLLSVKYTNLPDSSFSISLSNSNSISLSNSKGNKVANFDTLKAKQYLNYYSNIQYEALENNLRPGFKDSVLAKGAVHIITLTDRDGKIHTVKTFSKPAEKNSVDQLTGQPLTEDLERMFALINEDKDLVLIQYYVFGKLLPQPSYFKKAFF